MHTIGTGKIEPLRTESYLVQLPGEEPVIIQRSAGLDEELHERPWVCSEHGTDGPCDHVIEFTAQLFRARVEAQKADAPRREELRRKAVYYRNGQVVRGEDAA